MSCAFYLALSCHWSPLPVCPHCRDCIPFNTSLSCWLWFHPDAEPASNVPEDTCFLRSISFHSPFMPLTIPLFSHQQMQWLPPPLSLILIAAFFPQVLQTTTPITLTAQCWPPDAMPFHAEVISTRTSFLTSSWSCHIQSYNSHSSYSWHITLYTFMSWFMTVWYPWCIQVISC